MPAKRPVMPPTFFLWSVLVMVALHWLLPGWRLVRWPWTWLGLLPLLAGMGLAVAGSQAFQRAGTTVRPFSEAAALVTSGLYRYSRNPMYIGLLLGLVGAAIFIGSFTPWLVIPGFGLLLRWRFIAVEEQMLTAKFGAAYTAYQRRVRRWL